MEKKQQRDVSQAVQKLVPSILETSLGLERAVHLFEEFKRLKERLLTQDDIKYIGGKPYIMKPGWRKIKTFFRLSEQILHSERISYEKEGKQHVLWRYRVRVSAQDGTFTEAEGICSSEEPFAQGKPEHAICAMAQTRGYNRAISDFLGGEVSAEEMEGIPEQEIAQMATYEIPEIEKREIEKVEERIEEPEEEDRATMMKEMGSLMIKLGYVTIEDRRKYAEVIIGRQIKSAAELTSNEIKMIIRRLRNEARREF